MYHVLRANGREIPKYSNWGNQFCVTWESEESACSGPTRLCTMGISADFSALNVCFGDARSLGGHGGPMSMSP